MSDEKSKSGRDSRGRFAKNHSGNPGGRRRKKPSKPASSLDVIFERIVRITAPDGTVRELTAEEAIDQATLKDALSGKAGAIKTAVRMLIKRDKWIRSEADKKAQRAKKYEGSNFSDIKKYSDPQNADAAMQILGIATRDSEYEESVNRSGYVHLRLEHWAVEMALSRRRSSEPLLAQDINNINVCTHDPDNLTWPKGSRV